MKKIVRALLGGFAVATSLTVLASCGNEAKTTTAEQTSTKEVETSTKKVESYTVTFYDGKTVLKTETVEEGKKVASYTPEKEGYTFLGWYATPDFNHDFNFDAEITGETSVFAAFKSSQVVEDTRSWYILGYGSSRILKESNWGGKLTDEMQLAKTEGKNEFTLTVNLAVGDEFQFGINSSWEFQRGAGYMESYTSDGVEYFMASSGLAADTKKSNIKCLVEGNYTFTLTTNPEEDDASKMNNYDKITFKYNGESTDTPVEEPKLESYQLIIKGTMTEWKESDRMDSSNLKVEFNYSFNEGDEFGFAWFLNSEDTGYGTYINYTAIGTTGTANSDFKAADAESGNNNFKALATKDYVITVVISEDKVATVDFEYNDVK